MTELKTLKDFEKFRKTTIEKGIIHKGTIDIPDLVSATKLKQEAIKWLPLMHYQKLWKKFFNITEEDLK